VSEPPLQSPGIKPPAWTPLLCVPGDDPHEVPAVLVATYRRPCGHAFGKGAVLCTDHGTHVRRNPVAGRATRCEQCGELGTVTLDRMADITVHRYVGIVRGFDYEQRDVRDRQLQEWYQQHVRTLSRRGAVQPVSAPGPLGNWERLPESRHDRDRVAPSWRCTFSVVTCQNEP